MTPRSLASILGLCNVIAGALLVSQTSPLLGGLDGVDSAAADLLSTSLAVLLIAIGSGALRLPAAALETYLWIFGVIVKLVAALFWSLAARESGVGALWVAAAADVSVAVVIGIGLSRHRAGARA